MVTLALLLACETKVSDTGAAEGEDTAADSPADSPADSDTGADTSTDTATDTDDTGEWVAYDCPEDTSGAPLCPEGPDGDGDGWAEEDGDCDDCDPLAFPGAPELCDGVDQDCDGAAVAAGSCEAGIDFSDHDALPGWVGEQDYAYLGANSTNGGGSEEDLLFTGVHGFTPPGSTESGTALAIDRDLPDAALQPWPSGADFLTWAPEGTGGWGVRVPLGDHDGDGVSEVVLYTPSGGLEGDGVFLLDLPDGPCEAGSFDHFTRARWTVPEGDHDFAVGFDAAGDYDADGMDDMAILTSMRQIDGVDQPGRLYLVRGREGLAGTYDPLDEVVLTGSDPDPMWADRPNELHRLPDLDGDGGSELLLEAGVYGLAIGSGKDLLLSDGALLSDAFAQIEARDDAWPADFYVSPGDWDGDGIDDLAWTMMGEDDEDDDCLYIVSFPAPYEGDVLDDTLQQLCKPQAHAYGYLKGTHDLDGDGVLDPVFRWLNHGPDPDEPAIISTQYVVPTSWLDGGRAEVAEVGIRIGIEDDDAEREDLDFADLDDDGFPELISSSDEGPDATLHLEGWIQVLPGFDIPFDDPTAW